MKEIKKSKKILGAALAIGLMTGANANALPMPANLDLNAESIFGVNDAASPSAQLISMAENKSADEHKCGEGKCGEDHKCGEGKCGEDHKCGEGKCGADHKCGEGKCG